MKEPLVIYGAGGLAREVAWLLEYAENRDANAVHLQAVCFADRENGLVGQHLVDLPVCTLEQARSMFPGAYAVAALGDPRSREAAAEKLAAAGFRFTVIRPPGVFISKWSSVGAGSILQENSYFTTNVTIGRHVLLNGELTIGHDAVIGDFCTIGPGARISGHVHIGRRVYVGTNAVIIHGSVDKPLVIGDDAVIGASACVIRSVPAGATVVGVPARPIAD